MVFSSAYRRAYKEPSWDDYSKKEFISKLQYRSDRRSVEHRHQPWSWDSDSEEEDIEEIPAEDGSYDGGRHERAPRDERIIHKRAPKQAWGEERKEIKECDRALVLPKELTYEEEEEKKTKHLQVAGDVYRPKERDRGKRDGRKQHRSSEDIKKKYRSRSTSPEKKRKSKGEKNRVPFLPYGMANEGPVDMWKTHNVLASQREVYPAALRAQKRRQQEVKKKAQLREEAVKKKEMPSHFDVDVAFPKTWWMTEYQRNFCKEEDVKRHFLR